MSERIQHQTLQSPRARQFDAWPRSPSSKTLQSPRVGQLLSNVYCWNEKETHWLITYTTWWAIAFTSSQTLHFRKHMIQEYEQWLFPMENYFRKPSLKDEGFTKNVTERRRLHKLVLYDFTKTATGRRRLAPPNTHGIIRSHLRNAWDRNVCSHLITS